MRWKAVLLIGAIVFASKSSNRAADISRYSLFKSQFNIQTNSAAAVPAARPFQFWAQLWQTTNFSVSTATLTRPNFNQDSLLGGMLPLLLSANAPSTSQSFIDTFYPTGSYKFVANTLHNGTTNLTLNLPVGTYPVRPHINNQPALQNIDPSSSFTVSWDAYTGGTTNDLITLEIWNSAGIVFGTGAYLGAEGALDGLATNLTIPSSTLVAGNSYIGRLGFMHVMSTNYSYAPGFSAYAQHTDFYLATTGAVPPVLVSATPFLNSANVPGNVKITFNFNKPMRPYYSYLSIGTANTTTRTWSADQKSFTLTSSTLWPSNTTLTWYLNYMGGPPSFGDTDNNPLMTDTLGTRFVAGTNTLPAVPVAPMLQILGSPPYGATQIQLVGGEAFRSYQIESSDDLQNWSTLDTVMPTNSSFIFTDPAPAPTNRNYRAIALP